MLPQAGDCETLRSTFPAQPVAASTAVAFLVAALWLAHRHRDRDTTVFAGTLAGVGATSLWFHALSTAPATPESIAVVAMASWLGTWAQSSGPISDRRLAGWAAGVIAAAAIILLRPESRHAVTAGALVLAAVGVLPRARKVWTGLGTLGVGAALYALSRTGGPLCRPDSLFQGHGLWHILAAAALATIGDALAASARQ